MRQPQDGDDSVRLPPVRDVPEDLFDVVAEAVDRAMNRRVRGFLFRLIPSSPVNVCTRTVRQNFCACCGVCAGLCPSGNLVMCWTPEGLLQPNDQGKCQPECHCCLDLCPFVDHAEDESTLAKLRFGNIPGIRHTPETGYYSRAYVGHAGNAYRERGASGGMASWFLASLLERGEVDRVICVRPNTDPERLFAYSVAADPGEVQAGAKSANYPVELSRAIHTVLQEPNRTVT